ncbi:biotin carboxylase N-terminal domain-containing protein [Streptomyces sp. NBC_01190]|uniref:ATP-binding protein n=1 Tax=Streptomyces sp. NBC_01190 TaxID=2903767 RepID=UPI003866B464|nr:ATP-grasp domain-containing protein [Streptomyces sp. NBC_01190]
MNGESEVAAAPAGAAGAAEGGPGASAGPVRPAIGSVLVANRGEIARRVFRSCRDLGIATVAVHSDADTGAAHVREADAAVRLPGRAPADTYLRADLLVAAARAAGADAVHPGYGFLSENAGFARAVRDAGLVWIGPPAEAIGAMGSKTRAKELMAAAGVPLFAALDPSAVTAADLPVLVKAAAGGGGRGMRVVRELGSLADELAAAGAEAAAAFGDGEVFVEPYVVSARHVEVQVLADAHGTVWTLGERDCSVQRRHQKVIEETPAPGLSAEVRRALHEAAVRATRAIGYTGAGTVEFLVAPGADGAARPYFLEMNTRLQVEHPVTECVTGLDLVAWQIRVAEGAALPPVAPGPRGHAIEARLYAEDPGRDWQPQPGPLHLLEVPGVDVEFAVVPGREAGLRLDAGVTGGEEIGVHYDPLLAKVIAWAPTRAEAVRRLTHALTRTRLHGPATNRDLLVEVLRHPDFRTGTPTTAFLQQHAAELGIGGAPAGSTAPEPGPKPSVTGPEGVDRLGRQAALVAAVADAAARTAAAAVSGGPVAARLGGWRNVASQAQLKRYRAEPGGRVHEVRYRHGRLGPVAEDFPDVTVVSATPARVVLEVGGVRRAFDVGVYGDRVYVDSPVGSAALTALPRFTAPGADAAPGSLRAPMPGTVVRLGGAAAGDRVTAGQPLLWLEAMKMEHVITAPAAGTLSELTAEIGRQVELGAVLAVVKEDTGP